MKSTSFLSVTAYITLLSGHTSAEWQFRSRPDLYVPRLNITIPATNDIAPGYIFVAPYPSRGHYEALPEQPAAYIFRNNGDLVWSSLGYLSGFVANFHAVRFNGQSALQAFQGSIDANHGRGYGTFQILNGSYRPIAQVQGLTNKIPSIHEFRIVNEKTALIEIYNPTPYDLTPYGGTGEQKWIIDGILQEVDIETGELIFEIHSLDIVSPADSLAPILPDTGLTGPDGWDYFHLNSIDKDDEGNYLISARHTSAIYKLSGKDGSIIWQLGGKRSTFKLPTELKFSHQHDARFLNRSVDGNIETISFFDNSAWNFDDAKSRLSPHSSSRGLIVELNHVDNSAKLIREYISPDGHLAESQGNTQVLPNGNVFINWGQEGAVTEFRADGTPIFNAYLDSGGPVQNYRGFRHEWTGRPREVPAIVAVRSSKASTSVYVSWNGDTEVHLWRFYVQGGEQAEATTGRKIGQAKRDSFETVVTIPAQRIDYLGASARVFAAGFAVDGTFLIRSHAVVVREDVHAQVKKEGEVEPGEL
ncbi:arylsulfotransferase [Mariannaea sp. PMI_226]|nr:arylsulfotransferase [Mariannaea sp. PMI_226]